ncbi:hypothetical protein GCM10022267_73640 [Lentzea roselyniae]|uniref:Extracellular repeat, HAF family n=1 Tax=Lentzea roselyniae TaxID=531940 RepID=A0ABP7C101_9PSEU
MVFTGGWRVLVGALVLSAGVVAPATASADPAFCDTWTESELPKPDGVGPSGVAGAAGVWAVGNGSFRWTSGSAVLVWKDGQLVDQLSFFRNVVYASDVNSSGVVILTGHTFPAASRWQAGVYTTLRGWQGEHGVQAIDVNERGDVLGESDGKPVVWPAGSADARLVPGTDASWSAIGIADDGTVLASSNTGTYWLGASGPVQLGAGTDVEVRAVRGSYAAGRSGQQIVRWHLHGRESGPFAGAVDALSVNSHGHLLGTVDNGTTTGATAFWPDLDQQVGVDSGARFGVITDEGDLYGTRVLEQSSSYPVVLKCVRGA